MATFTRNTTKVTEREFAPSRKHTKIRKLGRGSYGVVYLAQDNKTKTYFVVKKLKENHIKSGKNEIERFLKPINHKRIIKTFGCDGFFTDREIDVSIFMEYAGNGTLKERIRLDMTEKDVAFYTRQILEGIKELHDRHIIHRDIKPDNILLDVAGNVKIGDFGLAREITSDANYTKTLAGTHLYMAPEVMTQYYKKVADIWSVGVITHEMVTGKNLWAGCSKPHIQWRLVDKNIPDHSLPDEASDELKEFVSSMLETDEKKRPSAAQLLESNFFKLWKDKLPEHHPISFKDEQRIYSFREKIKSIIDDENKIEELDLAIFDLATTLYNHNILTTGNDVKDVHKVLGIEFPANPDALYASGEAFVREQKINKASTAFVLAAQAYEHTRNDASHGIGDCVNQLRVVFDEDSNRNQVVTAKTMEMLVKRMKNLSNLDQFTFAVACNDVAAVYCTLHVDEKIVYYSEEATAMVDSFEKNSNIGHLYHHLGVGLNGVGRLEESKKAYLQAIEIYKSCDDWREGENNLTARCLNEVQSRIDQRK